VATSPLPDLVTVCNPVPVPVPDTLLALVFEAIGRVVTVVNVRVCDWVATPPTTTTVWPALFVVTENVVAVEPVPTTVVPPTVGRASGPTVMVEEGLMGRSTCTGADGRSTTTGGICSGTVPVTAGIASPVLFGSGGLLLLCPPLWLSPGLGRWPGSGVSFGGLGPPGVVAGSCSGGELIGFPGSGAPGGFLETVVLGSTEVSTWGAPAELGITEDSVCGEGRGVGVVKVVGSTEISVCAVAGMVSVFGSTVLSV
jgi:hypothetical protein